MGILRKPLLLSAALFCAGCSDPVQPVPLDFTAGSGSDRVEVTAGRDQVVIDGVITVALSCYPLEARSRREDDEIELEVIAVAREDIPCLTISGSHAYHVTFADLAPGSYRYQVTHLGGLENGRFGGRIEVGRETTWPR